MTQSIVFERETSNKPPATTAEASKRSKTKSVNKTKVEMENATKVDNINNNKDDDDPKVTVAKITKDDDNPKVIVGENDTINYTITTTNVKINKRRGRPPGS